MAKKVKNKIAAELGEITIWLLIISLAQVCQCIQGCVP